MASLTDYRGLKVVSPDPVGAGGLAIQNDLKELVDRLAASRYVNGMRLNWLDPVRIGVSEGDAISQDGALNINLPSPLTIDSGITGAGGLDTATLSANTVYYVHAIGDSSNSNPGSALLSLSADNPQLPPAYSHSRRIGFVASDAQSRILNFRQTWNGLSRRYYYSENSTRTRLLTDGSSTGFSAIDCSRFVPFSSRSIMLSAVFRNNFTPGGQNFRSARLRAAGDNHSGFLFSTRNGVGTRTGISSQIEMPCSESQQIEYRVNNANARLTLSLCACVDEL